MSRRASDDRAIAQAAFFLARFVLVAAYVALALLIIGMVYVLVATVMAGSK